MNKEIKKKIKLLEAKRYNSNNNAEIEEIDTEIFELLKADEYMTYRSLKEEERKGYSADDHLL